MGVADIGGWVEADFEPVLDAFAENFDALTGVGLRDRAYTWTASAYLMLAAAYLRRR